MKCMTCEYCNSVYIMGVTGTVRGCDKCVGVRREPDGSFWLPDETQKTRVDLLPDGSYGVPYTVYRRDIFPDGG